MGSSIPQRHLTWYLKSIAPILKEAERQCLEMIRCDAQSTETLRACFQEFRANLLRAIAQESRRWDEDRIAEHREKTQGTRGVRRVCLELIKRFRAIRDDERKRGARE